MKMSKKIFLVIFLGCIAVSASACSDKSGRAAEETAPSETELPMFETSLATTAVSGSETTESAQTTASVTAETTTETSTSAETTQTSEEPQTTAAETTTTETTTVPAATTTQTTTVTVATAPETSPASEAEVLSQKFEPGIWWASSSEGDRYFCFNAGSSSGSFRDQENGLGMAFNYEEENEESLVFHIGDADSETRASVAFADQNTAVLTWENGSTETLKYQGLGNFDTFRFYSNLELCEMALDYYEKNFAYRPGDAAAEEQPDGKIAIQLYDNFDDHNSTSAWYTVDRFTAKGTDIMGNAVSLAE